MQLLRTEGVSKSFGDRLLFSDISFSVSENDRIGLIGPNGCGKTTLLSILRKKIEPDTGKVSFSKNARVEAIDQVMRPDLEESLYNVTLAARQDLLDLEASLEHIQDILSNSGKIEDKQILQMTEMRETFEREGGLTFRSRARAVLLGLGFSEQDLERSYKMFSGGELRKAQLARLLLSESNMLLLDEPTNHLDIYSVTWLENYLSEYRGAMIVVSHDRQFLDAVTNRTFEITHGRMEITVGNYSKHLALMLNEQASIERQYLKTQKEIRRLKSVIEQQRRWNQERNYVTIASKQKQIDRLTRDLVMPDKKEATIRFRFSVEPPVTNEVISITGLKKSFGEKTVFEDVSFQVKSGEHVCLIGENGCGKTTLFRILMGLEKPDHGEAELGEGVSAGYFEQSATGSLEDCSVFDRIYDRFPRMHPADIKNALALFLFRGDGIQKNVMSLSGGELSRLRLLELMLSGKNTLLLDEPTNYLDIPSREQLEDAIIDFAGTALIVSHDRYFINRIADRILILSEEGVTEFSGDWSEYMEFCQEQQARRKKTASEKKETNNNAYLSGKKSRSERAKTRTEYRKVAEMISGAEERIAEYSRMLQQPEIASDYQKAAETAEKLEEQQSLLEKLMEQWVELDEKLSTQNGGQE